MVRESEGGLHLGSVSQVEKFLSGFQVSGGPDGGNAFCFCEYFRCTCDFSVFFDGRIYCSSAGMLAVWGSADWITGGKPAEGVAQVDGILSIVRGYKMEVGAFS